jgi:hypothetical protein
MQPTLGQVTGETPRPRRLREDAREKEMLTRDELLVLDADRVPAEAAFDVVRRG